MNPSASIWYIHCIYTAHTDCISMVHSPHLYGTHTGSIWYTHCIYMVYTLHQYSTYTASILYTHVLYMVHILYLSDIYTTSIQYIYCIYIVYIPHLYGTHCIYMVGTHTLQRNSFSLSNDKSTLLQGNAISICSLFFRFHYVLQDYFSVI